jgi:hypothetical protein
MGYGRLPLRGVPGVVGALARAMQSAWPDQRVDPLFSPS